MEVTFNEFKNAVNKLSISLYLGEGVTVELEEKGMDEAKFNPFTRVITLSFQQMKDHFRLMESADDIEKYIRADLYHEVSHVFMTPNNFYRNYKDTPYTEEKVSSALNIFEDERMETILSTFYYGVNFPESNIIMNNYHGEDAKNAREDFYYTVRFRHGKEEFLQRVEKMIEDTPQEQFNADSDGYYDGYDYKTSIVTLMEDIYRDWYETNEMDKILSAAPNYDSLSIEAKNEVIANLDYRENPPTQMPVKIFIGETEFGPQPNKPQEGEAGEEGEGVKIKIGKPGEESEESNGSKQSQDDAISNKDQWVKTYEEHVDPNKQRKQVQKMLESKMNKFTNRDLTKAIDEIFAEFAQKTKNSSTAAQRYSGRFNPREVGREDWRVWTYKDEHGPVKGYDKLHMNLFIDTSGSFHHNQDKVNTLLRSLIDLENKYKFFYFDLVTCQVSETLRTKDERYINCNGGNDLDDKVWDIYKKLQDSQSFNVNIALFDGGAFTDARGYDHHKNFGVFNSSHNSIISDSDNQKDIEKYSPQSHNIFVPRSGANTYPSLLFENIVKSINMALK